MKGPPDALDAWERACLVEYLTSQAKIRKILEAELTKDRSNRGAGGKGRPPTGVWAQAKVSVIGLGTRRPAASAEDPAGSPFLKNKTLDRVLSKSRKSPVRSRFSLFLQVTSDGDPWRMADFDDGELVEFRVGF